MVTLKTGCSVALGAADEFCKTRFAVPLTIVVETRYTFTVVAGEFPVASRAAG